MDMPANAALTRAKSGPLRTFDPVSVARYEKDSWVAYYKRQWLTLLRLLIGLVRSTYGLSLWQAIYISVLLTRAQIAFAPARPTLRLIALIRLTCAKQPTIAPARWSIPMPG